jgi:RNA polymerase sigma-70 factor, ECF subfamily
LSAALAHVDAPPADATRQLYERHSSRIFGFCLSRLGSREEAEDAVQTTFLNVQRGLGRGIVPEYELAWLFKIAQNVCHNRHQSARRRGRVEAAHDLDALQDVIASPDRNPAVSLGELTHALGAIPTRQRRALLLREFQGYSYDEIASELGISVGAVETLLFRARRAVAQQLEQSGTTSSTRRGAAASVVEVFRWLFGGATAPLKLAAVTAVVATTASLSVGVGHKSAPAPPKQAPVAPVIVERSAVVPASTGQPRNVAHSTARPVTANALSEQGPVAKPAVSILPTVQTASSGPVAQPALSSSPLVESTLAPAVPTALVPDLGVPEISLPAVTVPAITVPAITLPAVTVPAVVLPNVQLPPTPALPKLP